MQFKNREVLSLSHSETISAQEVSGCKSAISILPRLHHECGSIDFELGNGVGMLEQADGEQRHVELGRRSEDHGGHRFAVSVILKSPIESVAQKNRVRLRCRQIALVVDEALFLHFVQPNPIVDTFDFPVIDFAEEHMLEA